MISNCMGSSLMFELVHACIADTHVLTQSGPDALATHGIMDSMSWQPSMPVFG